jgi:hypothetical protein
MFPPAKSRLPGLRVFPRAHASGGGGCTPCRRLFSPFFFRLLGLPFAQSVQNRFRHVAYRHRMPVACSSTRGFLRSAMAFVHVFQSPFGRSLRLRSSCSKHGIGDFVDVRKSFGVFRNG